MSRELHKIGIPVSHYIQEAIFIIKKNLTSLKNLKNNKDVVSTIVDLLSSIELEEKIKKNLKYYENTYKKLIDDLISIYEKLDDSHKEYLLIPIGYLLGNKEVIEKCHDAHKEKSSLNDQEKNIIKELIKENKNTSVKFPEFIETELIFDSLKEEGSAAIVYKYYYLGTLIALKSQKSIKFNTIKEEAQYLARCQECQNIVKFLGIINAGIGFQPSYMMEFMPLDLADVLVDMDGKKTNLPPFQMSKIIKDITNAISFLHLIAGIIHRDIKPDNVLLNSEMTLAKLADFDYACKKKKSFKNLGTKYYIAPEIGNGGYDESVDIYSFGVMIWVMLTLCLPSNEDRLNPIDGLPNDTHPELKNLISSTFNSHPEQRKKIQEIKAILDNNDNLFGKTQSK